MPVTFNDLKQIIPYSANICIWEIRGEDDIPEVDLGKGYEVKKVKTKYDQCQVKSIFPLGDGELAVSIDYS